MLETGTIVAGYRIDGVLGDGGMGVVYRATQLSLEREVALKLLSSDLGNDSGFRIRFQREGQLQAALDHDHIVPVYEAGQSEHGLFLAMRLIDGPTLKDLILDGDLDPRRTVRLLAQVAHALDAAHAAGLIHRDIKPQNILIGRGDHAFLADFGLIKAPDEAARLTGTGQFIGTIDYVAPEQIQGDPASAASDIYALTGVLYECLTGEVPFPRPNEAATLHSHVIAPPPRATERRPELPAAVDDVIARGMAKDPEARPPSATELIVAATRALASAPGLGSVAGAPGVASGAQATVVRPRPAAVSPEASTPALDRASDGVPQTVAEPSSAPAPPVADDDWLSAPTIVPGARVEPEVAESEAEPERDVSGPEPDVAELERDVAVPEPEVTGPERDVAGAEPEEVEPDEDEEPDEEWEELPGAYERPARAVTPRLVEPPPARAPEPAPARGRARRPVGALVLVALLAAAAVGGYLVGHVRPRGHLAAFTNSAAVNHIELRYPPTWQLSASPTVVPGMRFDAPLGLSHAGRGRLTAGTDASAAGPTLLGRSFRARVAGGLPAPEPVRLGTSSAYRYTGVRLRGLSAPLVVYAAPTAAGVATIACWDPSGSDRTFEDDCTRIASTLRLIGTTAYPLGPSPAYATQLSGIFGRLRASLRGPQAALAGAKSASAEAAAAQQLAGAYGAAAAALDHAATPPRAREAQGGIVAALRRCASAYGAVAAAAKAAAAIPPINATSLNTERAAAQAAYGHAAGGVSAASAGLSRALRGLSSLGYTLIGQR